MSKENDLEAAAGQECRSRSNHRRARSQRTRSGADRWLVTRSRGGRYRDLNETRLLCEHPNDATISGQFGVCGFGFLPPSHATLNYRWCLINLENAH